MRPDNMPRPTAPGFGKELPELLRCPFCGSDNVILIDNDRDKSTRACCNVCGASTRRVSFGDEDEAIAAWNTRASLTPTPAPAADVVERLTDQLETEQEVSAKLAEQLTAREAELARVRKDAERYRWLRNDPPIELAVRRHPGKTPKGCYLDGYELDIAIDAALASQPTGDKV